MFTLTTSSSLTVRLQAVAVAVAAAPAGLGLTSERARWAMAERLARGGIVDEDVLQAMATVLDELRAQWDAANCGEGIACPAVECEEIMGTGCINDECVDFGPD